MTNKVKIKCKKCRRLFGILHLNDWDSALYSYPGKDYFLCVDCFKKKEL